MSRFFWSISMPPIATSEFHDWSSSNNYLKTVGRGQIHRSNAFRADATALDDLLEAHAGGRGSVLTPAVDLLEAGAAVEADRGFLVNARLEHEASGTQLLRRRFNGGQ